MVAELVFFTVHAAQVLSYPYPLDYGEGPLLAQVNLLLSGTPVWRLYADPGQPPYAVVNYPPVYHLLTTPLAWLLGALGVSAGGHGAGGDPTGGRPTGRAGGLAGGDAGGERWRCGCWRAGDHRPPTTDHRPSQEDKRTEDRRQGDKPRQGVRSRRRLSVL